MTLKQLKNVLSEVNLIAYEKDSGSGKLLREALKSSQSVTIVIGPEGGFDPSEVDELMEMGFECVSLGKRILRAETASIGLTSVVMCLMGEWDV